VASQALLTIINIINNIIIIIINNEGAYQATISQLD
jgi:hypothetical protein